MGFEIRLEDRGLPVASGEEPVGHSSLGYHAGPEFRDSTVLRFMALADPLLERLQSYRPVLDRVIFGLSLVGVLVVTHLFIQQSRNFDRGCFGFSSLDAAEQTFNCSAVLSSPSGQLLGVSNLGWGLGFYLLVAGLTAALFWVRSEIRGWVHGVRAAFLVGGFCYSIYLSYLQATTIGAFCALCLVSAAVVTLLFGTQLAALVTQPSTVETPMPSRILKREVTVYVYLVALTAVLVGADLTYFNGLERLSSQQDAQAATVPSEGSPGAQCQLDPSKQPVENGGASLVQFQDIIQGNTDADVTVIEYFDPNCPHCKTFHATMKKVVEAHRDDVRFVFKPFPLQRGSLPEIQALYVAAQSGKFSELLDALYARQGEGGINTQELRASASEVGMNPDVLISRIEKDQYRNQVLRLRKRARQAGVDSTPTVLVNGHFLGDRSFECLNTFIEHAQNGTLGTSASTSE